MIKNELTSAATDKASLEEQVSDLRSKLAAAEAEAAIKSSQPPAENENQTARIKELEEQLAIEKAKFADLEKEQEDLLVCMGKCYIVG